MRISDLVAQYIMDMLDEQNGDAQIKRNELAETIGCVPSQISYVITSRFTPEQGYIVESRRGGGGCIRITRIQMEPRSAVMNIINSVGSSMDAASAVNIIKDLYERGIISTQAARLINCAMSDRVYADVPPEYRDALRASLLKNMLLNAVNE